jgi:proteasome lid subunit RPN8/RPN11
MSCSISASAVDSIRRHLVAEYPREGCGLLVGFEELGERIVEYAVPTRNAERDPHRYSIAPEVFLAAEKAARTQGLEVLGFFHSHPDLDPQPSKSDVAEGWSHYTYLIVSVRGGEYRSMAAWRFGSGCFEPVPLRISQPSRETR